MRTSKAWEAYGERERPKRGSTTRSVRCRVMVGSVVLVAVLMATVGTALASGASSCACQRRKPARLSPQAREVQEGLHLTVSMREAGKEIPAAGAEARQGQKGNRGQPALAAANWKRSRTCCRTSSMSASELVASQPCSSRAERADRQRRANRPRPRRGTSSSLRRERSQTRTDRFATTDPRRRTDVHQCRGIVAGWVQRQRSVRIRHRR